MLCMTERHERLGQAGAWLRDARETVGLTGDQLGEMIGTSGANISNYERGISEMPDHRTARLAAALRMSEADVRRGLGKYVPGDDDGDVDIIAAIKRDPRLIPEARRHLANQYKLLLRLNAVADDEAGRENVLDLPYVARKRQPRKQRD